MDVLIKNARLQTGQIIDIALRDGLIAALEPNLDVSADKYLDAQENLLLPLSPERGNHTPLRCAQRGGFSASRE